jgi:hypothetical protein
MATRSSHWRRSGLRPLVGEQAALAGLAVQGRQQHEGHAGGGQHALPALAAGAVGIDHGRRGRRVLAHQVVVDHHHFEADDGGAGDGVIGRGAAVQGDHQLGAAVADGLEGRRAGAIALGQAIGNIDRQLDAHVAEPAHQLGGAGGPVDVVVGEHHGRPAAFQRVDQDLRGPVHVGEAGRVGEQRLQRRAQIVLGMINADPARRQGAGQGLGQAVDLLVAARRRQVARPLAPGPAADRAGDVEEVAGGEGGVSIGHGSALPRGKAAGNAELGCRGHLPNLRPLADSLHVARGSKMRRWCVKTGRPSVVIPEASQRLSGT